MQSDLRAVEQICALMRRVAGIDLPLDKGYLIRARLGTLARGRGLSGPEAVLRELSRGCPELEQEVVESLTTNETFFFRDSAAFEALERDIVPDIIARNAEDRSIRIWSAACSTGQEALSVAILVEEALSGQPDWSVEIIASDLDRVALARAREGRYHAGEVTRGLDERRLAQFFVPSGKDWVAGSSLLRKIEFRHLNLVQPWPEIGHFDLILVRNVLMYLTLEARASVLGRAAQHLGASGRLLLGAGESLIGVDVALERVKEQRVATYQRVPGAECSAPP